MPNRLINETSPYLLQHAHNPVDWYPWGEEALERARLENRPIFLSIGYAACHWCHVMEHESFEDIETARIMNEGFISIKVDREERPDLDSIYMAAVTAMTGSGGWPMSLFLTPDGRPFYGGTYFPPQPRYGMPGFKEVLLSVMQTWKETEGEVQRVADKLTSHLRESGGWNYKTGQQLNPEMLKSAASELLQSYNRQVHGWGQAPLFPQPMSIEFLLLQATRGEATALDVALDVLSAMSRGGIYDVVGGGFHRYSTDAQWLVPHFEKMLYDNAQLALVYLHAHLLTEKDNYRQICIETLEFISREMEDPSGGFYSSLDADSEGEEGKYYLWTIEELQQVVSNPQDFDLLVRAYGLSREGNFEGKIILQRQVNDETLAKEFDLTLDSLRERITRMHHALWSARQARVRPATDDKVLVSWNALALLAFAEAARYLRRVDYLETARKNADFLLTHLYQEGRLLRAWRAGQARHNAFLEDYAGLTLALLALYQSDPDVRWYRAAVQMGEEMVAAFKDEKGGFFDVRQDHDELLLRPKEFQDNATPSGNALAAMALLQLSEYGEHEGWREMAEAMLGGIQEMASRYPSAFAYWLQAMDFQNGPVKQVAIIYPQMDSRLAQLVDYLWQTYRPRLVAALSPYPPPDQAAELLRDRPLREGAPTVYLCEGFTCQLPVNTMEGLQNQLPATTRPG